MAAAHGQATNLVPAGCEAGFQRGKRTGEPSNLVSFFLLTSGTRVPHYGEEG